MSADFFDQLLQKWQCERPDLDFSGLATLGRMDFVAYYWVQMRESNLKGLDLTLGESEVLLALRMSGQPFSLTPSQLIDQVVCSSGGMTKMLDSLESREFVRRAPSPTDRRSVLVELTNTGKKLADQVVELESKRYSDFEAILCDCEKDQLVSILRKLLANVESNR